MQERLPEDEAPGRQRLKFLGTLHGARGWLLALCVPCLGVTLLCYLFSDDLKLLSWQVHVPKLLQGTTNAHPSQDQELQPTPPLSTSLHPCQDPGPLSDLTVVQGSPRVLPACPEESPRPLGSTT
ncbi:hypothetical protein U0070_025130 [Myodes glareolus]|uniref:Uncharacterized protein n=1 Tax=Myodes glareolus TaxID=447135 RepID=A0AAW0I7W2_MYOGA